jgi:tRNA(Arg) A34 adenosine deaminase TadA
MNYLQQAIDLSSKSFEAGEFPAGAVLVTKSGNVYESDPSLPYYHGECMVIDKAVRAEGYPLTGAVMYASMEPCLMCSAKLVV